MRIAFVLGLIMGVVLSSPSSAENDDGILLETRNFVLARNYRTLERLSSQYRDSKEKTADGLWKLERFYAAFDQPEYLYGTSPAEAVEELQSFTGFWLMAYPDSPAAHIIDAMVLLRKGWNARGGGTSETVTRDGWRVFRENVRLAGEKLEAYPAGAKDPQWHAMMIQQAIAADASGEGFRKVMDAALAQEPSYGWTISNIVKRFLPQWGGNKVILDEVVRYIVSHNVEADRPAIYTRAYWSVAFQLVGGSNPFKRESADWSMMKAGFEQITEEYPTRHNSMAFASFACLADDLQTAKRIIEKLAPLKVDDGVIGASLARCSLRYAEPK